MKLFSVKEFKEIQKDYELCPCFSELAAEVFVFSSKLINLN